jgi:hypothetical protein
MASLTFELDVEMDDGATYQVVADQRDIARWEVQPFGWPIVKVEDHASMSFFRFLGWSAMFRQQLTTLKWEQFNDTCVEVLPADDDEDGTGVPDDAEDPGRPAASAIPS